MSYEKVKSIKIDLKQNKVFINCASNNVRPLYYTREEYPYFSKILQTDGLKECEIALLKSYEEGNLQGGNTKYNKALKILRFMFTEEYKKFDWRGFSYEDREKEQKMRNSQEFKDLLYLALTTNYPRKKFLVSKNHYNGKCYVKKTTNRHIFFTYEKNFAKTFDFIQEAQGIKGKNENYEIEEVFR